jgi:hypothetical protein
MTKARQHERQKRRQAEFVTDEEQRLLEIEDMRLVVKFGELRLSEHVADPDGAVVFRQACVMGLEGIVAKRRDSRYRSGRPSENTRPKRARLAPRFLNPLNAPSEVSAATSSRDNLPTFPRGDVITFQVRSQRRSPCRCLPQRSRCAGCLGGRDHHRLSRGDVAASQRGDVGTW